MPGEFATGTSGFSWLVSATTGVATMPATSQRSTANTSLHMTFYGLITVRRKRLNNGIGHLTAMIHSIAPIDETDVRTFSDTLIDYVATGHFRLYAEILSLDTGRFRGVRTLANDYYPVIARSTELALIFSDRHTVSSGRVSKALFSIELSVLEEALAQRFIVEDELIEQLSSSRNVLPFNINFSKKRGNASKPSNKFVIARRDAVRHSVNAASE